MIKNDFLNSPELIEECEKINQIAMNSNRSTSGPASWTNTRTSVTYSVSTGGELALAKKIRDDNADVFGVLDIVTDLNAKQYGSAGTTAERPTLATTDAGYLYFETTLARPIWWTGATWVDSTGTVV